MLHLWDLEEQRGRGFKVIKWMETEKSEPQNERGRANFYGGVDPSNFLSNYLIISAPFGVKKVL